MADRRLKIAIEAQPPLAPAGRREQNKSDKLRRIKDAARELFIARSFDETTTREIALKAGVGMGTIFLYADNKRDLLFLIANDDLTQITEKSTSAAPSGNSVLADFMNLFRLHYEFFGAQPELSRSMLREMTFYDSGKQARQFQTIRGRVLQHLESVVARAQERGEIRQDENAQFLGWVAFCIYQVELRQWLTADKPNLKTGLKRLEKALSIYLTGAAKP
jgi:AcrR family transcriptional regulator